MNVRRREIYVLLFYVALGLAAYSSVLDAFFISDDFELLGWVIEGWPPLTWGREQGGFFRPVFVLSFYVDAAVWGIRPVGFHLTNAVLHALNSFLVFLLTRALFGGDVPAASEVEAGRGSRVAFVAGLLFLIHPSHTEAVAWVAGRVDLLPTLFFLLSALSYVRHVRARRRDALVLALASFALALLAKESAACLPLFVFMFGAYFDEGGNPAHRLRRGLLASLPFLAVLGVYVAARAAVLGMLVGGYGAERHLNFTHSVVASQLLRFSLRAFLPALVLRELPFLESRALSPVLIAAGALVALFAAALLLRRERRTALRTFARRHGFVWLSAVMFACALLPVINLRINVFDTQGERYLYLPSVFYASGIACVLARGRMTKPRAAALAALLIFYAAGLWATNQNWREAGRLSESILRELPAQATRDAVLLLNAPDNLRGAYVYRNGLERALVLFQQSGPISRAHILAWHGLETGRERIELIEERGTYLLRPPSEATKFERVGTPPGCARDLNLSEGVLRVRLADCAGTLDVFYLDEGEIRRVEIIPKP